MPTSLGDPVLQPHPERAGPLGTRLLPWCHPHMLQTFCPPASGDACRKGARSSTSSPRGSGWPGGSWTSSPAPLLGGSLQTLLTPHGLLRQLQDPETNGVIPCVQIFKSCMLSQPISFTRTWKARLPSELRPLRVLCWNALALCTPTALLLLSCVEGLYTQVWTPSPHASAQFSFSKNSSPLA